jgi:hypothetical protein
VVRGAEDSIPSPRIGTWNTSDMQQAIKRAMDPQAKFPGV